MPTIAFTTLGCRVNQYDTDSMRGLFAAAGYEEADFSDPADGYVINTCSVTHVLSAIPGVDAVIGTNERKRIVQVVESLRNERSGRTVQAVHDIMGRDEFEEIPLYPHPR